MPIKKWLNDHPLSLSAIGFSLLVALLFWTAALSKVALGFPYLDAEYRFQDWVAQNGRTAVKDPRLYFLADDAPSHHLDQLWDDEIEASPALKLMKKAQWSREVWAHVLERLAGAGARVVAFDYMYKGENEGDAAFKAMLDKYAHVAVVGSHIDDAYAANNPMPQITGPHRSLIEEPTDPRVGFINIHLDEDGIVRRVRFRVTREELAGKPEMMAMPDQVEFESFAGRMAHQAGEGGKIPPGRGAHRIRYAYKGETLNEENKPQSLCNIFVPAIWEANFQNGEFFRDKIVLVGPEGNYTKDVGLSPFGLIAGPEFHLNALNAILTGEFLEEIPVWRSVLLILGCGLVAWLLGRLVAHPVVRMAILPILCFAVFQVARYLYDAGVVIPVFSPMLTLVGATMTGLAWQQIVERLARARLRKTFERYVSRDIVKELVDNPSSYLNTVGGVRKNVTVLFSDVRGFTTITESGDAHALVAQLNEYFDHMVNIVFANYGTLDKFIGDAVMAQWGGIYSEGEKTDATRAVRTAVQMRKTLNQLNEDWRKRDMLELKFGIGINHGEAIVGNLGCEAKMEVSLIGDAVNTASRFEGMTKAYHVDLLIGESVGGFVKDEFIVRSVALSQPKGKTKPVEIFTVLDERRPGEPEPEWLRHYEEGVRLFRNREFAAAVAAFEKSLALNPGDWLTEDYLEKSRNLASNPPAEDWSPVDVLTSK